MKICIKCKIEKKNNEFPFRDKNKETRRNECLICIKKYSENYYEKNKPSILESAKQYYIDNKDKILKDVKTYREENSDLISEYKKEYYEGNKNS